MNSNKNNCNTIIKGDYIICNNNCREFFSDVRPKSIQTSDLISKEVNDIDNKFENQTKYINKEINTKELSEKLKITGKNINKTDVDSKILEVNISPTGGIKPNLEVTSIQNRDHSCKATYKKINLRPNTALNKNNNFEVRKDLLKQVKKKISEENIIPQPIKINRPMTAMIKPKDDNKIINININYFNIDLNQRYFDPKSEKQLLHLNRNMMKDQSPYTDQLQKVNLNNHSKPSFLSKFKLESARVTNNPFKLNQCNDTLN